MVHTHQNGSGADQTHDDTGKDGRDTEQHIQHPCQTLADVNAHGTNDRQGKEAGNEQGDGGVITVRAASGTILSTHL